MMTMMKKKAMPMPIPRLLWVESFPRFESAPRAAGCVIGRALMVGSNVRRGMRSDLEGAMADVSVLESCRSYSRTGAVVKA